MYLYQVFSALLHFNLEIDCNVRREGSLRSAVFSVRVEKKMRKLVLKTISEEETIKNAISPKYTLFYDV